MNEFTFGKTPAALYLVRVLKDIGDPGYSRTVGKRITATTEQVADLVNAYQEGVLTPKTVANTLRLMREEVAKDGVERDRSLTHLADQLRRNVQIGAIKRGMRLTSMARKAEKIMTNPINRSRAVLNGLGEIEHYFRDRQSGMDICAGSTFTYEDTTICSTATMEYDKVSDTTPELLMKRSVARCERLKKPHTLAKS